MNKNAQNLQTLKNIVGDKLFIAVAESLNGEHIVFNNHSCQGFISKAEQNAQIVKDFYDGKSQAELAEKYGLEISTIYRIVEQKPI